MTGLSPAASERICVLLAASGEPWEAAALRELGAGGVVVLKRCVDLPDLLGTAASGQAHVALVAAGLPGLDADAVARLLRHDVRTLAVEGTEEVDPRDAEWVVRLGAAGLVSVRPPGSLLAAVHRVAAEEVGPVPDAIEGPLPLRDGVGRVVAVWGPAGAPGRTTVAIALAAQHAHAGATSVLVDADPYGGAVAQHLGVLDEVSGLLAAARLANTGRLDAASFADCRRRVGERFDILSGLPRADRWVEVRSGAVEAVLGLAAEVGDVVVDCGFCLEADHDAGRNPGRNQLTLDSLEAADEVLVVGSAEPTGLARLARGLVELRELVPGTPLRVVVNRMRDSLGWRERDIIGMVEGYAFSTDVHFLPEDRSALDRALVAGKALPETGDSPLRKAVAKLETAALGLPAQLPNSR